ncbi:MAG: metal-sensitive transcriptional regulator [Lactococcus lactis]|uniref:metal-sensitive transcriptional regulator n=1 Tax=Lactococcus lactis TaxID=1358 RepID=UPI00207893F1|nr:metal-sensitive transcriptional regulator [Lactococcus lactis]MCT3107568.1 metal-sensitive transcriptional regulator [Lactococcus lactis]MDN5424447.1 metal-sensitive transcriptional regulator [Lactococcus lactis]MDN5946106.1 metal-sensitive transcriptional regulator [Lactococcus lactis]MDN5948460.1 metal-sensitive transcriptional regulator [Lactococcus lactis]MDN5959152.1 metal-sensitive transcriptional regulator [Lactococcus lactis]
MKKYDKKMKNRLKRATGQLTGILKMMESREECIDVVTQLTAVRSSLDSLIGLIVAENLKELLLDKEVTDKEEKLEQAIKLIIKK